MTPQDGNTSSDSLSSARCVFVRSSPAFFFPFPTRNSIYGPEDSACPQCHTVFVSPAVTPEAKVAELALGILDTELNDVVSTSDF